MQDFEVIALFRRKYIGFEAFFKQYRQQNAKNLPPRMTGCQYWHDYKTRQNVSPLTALTTYF